MLSAVIPSIHSYSALQLALQQIHQRYVQSGPLVLGSALLNFPTPIKVARELGSERRETVRSLSVVGAGYLKGAVLSTRGPGRMDLWCIGCHASGTAE